MLILNLSIALPLHFVYPPKPFTSELTSTGVRHSHGKLSATHDSDQWTESNEAWIELEVSSTVASIHCSRRQVWAASGEKSSVVLPRELQQWFQVWCAHWYNSKCYNYGGILVPFSITGEKLLDKWCLKEKGLLWPTVCGYSSQWQGKSGSRSMRQSVSWHPQSGGREMDADSRLTSSILYIVENGTTQL